MKKIILSILAVGCLLGQAHALSLPQKPYPEKLVNDFAEVIPEWQADSLENALVAFDDSTSNQIAIVTVTDLEGLDVADYAVRLANEWGIGSSKNNGILILIKPRGFVDNYIDVTIQVGRGLEGAIPDVYASRIIRNLMGPYLSENEYVAALANGCAELMALAAGEISEPRDKDDESDDDWIFVVFMFAFIICLVIILAAAKSKTNNRGDDDDSSTGGSNGGPRTIFFGPGFGSSHRGSFGGMGGGGFGGFGGGSFGGGGASGRF